MIYRDENTIQLADRCQGCTLAASALCRASRTMCGSGAKSLPNRRTFGENETLFMEGDTPGALGVLKAGYVRYQKISRDGRRLLLGLASPGDVVGLLPGRQAVFDAETASDAEICLFDPRSVDGLLRGSHHFRHYLLSTLSDQLEQMRDLVWLCGALSSRERIMAFLIRAAQIMPTEPQPDGSVIVSIPLSRRDWADFSNTTVESISRTLTGLSRSGLVKPLRGKRFRIADLARLAKAAGIDPVEEENRREQRATGLTAINDAPAKAVSNWVGMSADR